MGYKLIHVGSPSINIKTSILLYQLLFYSSTHTLSSSLTKKSIFLKHILTLTIVHCNILKGDYPDNNCVRSFP